MKIWVISEYATPSADDPVPRVAVTSAERVTSWIAAQCGCNLRHDGWSDNPELPPAPVPRVHVNDFAEGNYAVADVLADQQDWLDWSAQVREINALFCRHPYVVDEVELLEDPAKNACPFDFSHTRHWCGYAGCREG